MDRSPLQHRLLVDRIAKTHRDLAFAETDGWNDPLGPAQSLEGAAMPPPTHAGRGVYLRWNNHDRLTIAYRAPRFPIGRVVAGLALFGVAGALVIGLPRYNFSPTIKTLSGTTYNTAVTGLTSAVNAGLDWIGKSAVSPVTTKDVALISKPKAPNARRTTGTRRPIDASRPLQLAPLISTETVRANGPAPIGTADVTAPLETRSKEALTEALPLPPDASTVEAATIYSPGDTDVSPPVAIRSPGIARDRGNGDKDVSFVEILVSETGQVESARGRQRPATLGAALQSNTALSVVKTWRFRPARRNGQPVKYRTTVPFIETFNPAGTTESR